MPSILSKIPAALFPTMESLTAVSAGSYSDTNLTELRDRVGLFMI